MTDISKESLRGAIAGARRQHIAGAGTVIDALMRSTQLTLDELGEALATFAGVYVLTDVNLARGEPDGAVISPEDARSLGCALLTHPEFESSVLLMADPWASDVVRTVTQKLGRHPAVVAATTEQLQRCWEGCEGRQAGSAAVTMDRYPMSEGSSPVVAFVNDAIRAAYRAGASDIHFECDRRGVQVKFRQDGVMVPFALLAESSRAEEVISRIKVLAQLDITERRTPQDGRFRFKLEPHDIDLRVSIMPSVFGEDAVLRLLDKAQLRSRDASISLDLLGFGATHVEQIRELAELPHGMLLVTGPTGSGKTTTVYAMLSEVNNGMEKIITIEDPVEYELPGVLQIPVNERKGLTFAKGLRSILRHDPDRILVGEIRDAETAEIAVQSALTGHQVLTTVHANSIYDVTGRFRHFGLDIFGFMSALNGVIVQRLVRRLCRLCARERESDDRERRWLAKHGAVGCSVFEPVGCPACNGHGYLGRSVLAEVHEIDDGLRDLVTSAAPVSALRQHVASKDQPSLANQAVQMVISGVSSPEEMKRVVGWQ